MTDDMTSKLPGAPDLKAAAKAFAKFCDTVAALRDKKNGCPWDLEQDHLTLRRYMLEEAYEAAEAMSSGDPAAVCDELGDVLLQVVLNSQIAHDHKQFAIADVISAIDSKMHRRHPHVFGTEAQREEKSRATIRSNWDQIKAAELAKAGVKTDTSFFAEAKTKHPASMQALKIGKLAAKIHFDWDNPKEVFAQVRSEIDELEAELERQPQDQAKLAEELGDVFFSLSQLCRHLSFDPETLALDANKKFLRRFAVLESIAKTDGIDIATASRPVLEDLWVRVKQSERQRSK